MGLKREIARMKVERACQREEEAEAKAAKEAREQAEYVDKARAIYKAIPDLVKEALAEDRDSIMLVNEGDIPGEVRDLSKGVAYEVYLLLKGEGLEDALWIDIDCSGNYAVQNALHMRL